MITEKNRIIKYTTILGKKLTKQNYQNFYRKIKYNKIIRAIVLRTGRVDFLQAINGNENRWNR